MRRVAVAIVALLAIAGAGLAIRHAGRSQPLPPAPPDPAPSAPSLGDAGLKRTLGLLVDVTTAQESGKDATCWTTVRMMDAHFAGLPMGDATGVIKIEACRTLVYRMWQEASKRAASADLDGKAIAAALPERVRAATELMVATEPEFGTDPQRSVMNRDYHRITENKRYLESIIAGAIAGAGMFEHRRADLKPLDRDGIARLAAAATVVTTDFLSACGKIARTNDHREVTPDDIRDAFARSLKELGLSEDDPQAVAPAAAAPDAELLSATRKEITGKISALRSWNEKVWRNVTDPAERQMELVNRMVQAHFDRPAFDELQRRLVPYAAYFACGVAPMKRNTFWTPVNGQAPTPAPLPRERKAFVDLPWAANAMEDLFPRSIASNGDVTIELMGDPGVPVAARSQRVQLVDWELDALRDTTLHWCLLDAAWGSPEARPADPFALELLADRMSELALFFIKSADETAKRLKRETITSEICSTMLMDVQFAAPAPATESWSPDDLAEKARVLARYPGHLYTDASMTSGIPTTAALPREGFGAHGPGDTYMSISFVGSGVAVGDFDGDGLPDLFLAGDGGNRLLRNLGGMRFEDVTERLGIDDPDLLDAHHPLFVDYDNDGRLDLFIVHSDSSSRLYHQEADGHFRKVSDSGLVTGPAAHDAVFFDYDNDGLLDCYVGHYGKGSPSLDGRNGGKNLLFHNLGNGRFEDVTDKAGVGSTGWTLSTAAIDVNRDGLMDLFVANDYGRSELFINRGDGTFVERGAEFRVDDRGSSMNASVIDIDGDGWMDLYITQIDMFSKSIGWVFPQPDSRINLNDRILKSTFYIAGNKLFRNQDGRRFEAVDGRMFEPGDRGWSWSGNFFDYDNDGDDDMYLTTGWVKGTPAADQANQMFIRQGDRFYVADPDGPECYLGNSRGAVAADLTGNGRIDLVVNAYGAPPRLLANACANGNHWVKVRLHGTRSNRFGIGAVVTIKREDGTVSSRQVNCGANYLSQDETTLTFGIGTAESASSLTVTWPGNREQSVPGPIKGGTIVEVTEAVPPGSR